MTCSFMKEMMGVQLQLDSDFQRGEPLVQECDWLFVTYLMGELNPKDSRVRRNKVGPGWSTTASWERVIIHTVRRKTQANSIYGRHPMSHLHFWNSLTLTYHFLSFIFWLFLAC